MAQNNNGQRPVFFKSEGDRSDKKSHGDIDESKVKAPNMFERVKEESDAVIGAIHQHKSSRDDFDKMEFKYEKPELKHLNRNRGHEPSGEEERHKSKKKVMEEIIMKSKLSRMENGKHKEEKEKLMDEVDKDFMSLDFEMMESLNRPSEAT